MVKLSQVEGVVKREWVSSNGLDEAVNGPFVLPHAAINKAHLRVGDRELGVELGCGLELGQSRFQVLLLQQGLAASDEALGLIFADRLARGIDRHRRHGHNRKRPTVPSKPARSEICLVFSCRMHWPPAGCHRCPSRTSSSPRRVSHEPQKLQTVLGTRIRETGRVCRRARYREASPFSRGSARPTVSPVRASPADLVTRHAGVGSRRSGLIFCEPALGFWGKPRAEGEYRSNGMPQHVRPSSSSHPRVQ